MNAAAYDHARFVFVRIVMPALCCFVSATAFGEDGPPRLEEKQAKALGKVDDGATRFVVVSPNGERLAWVFKKYEDASNEEKKKQKDQPKQRLVCDGKMGNDYVAVAEKTVHFSPDGSRIACRVSKPKTPQPLWMCDGVEYDSLPEPAFAFSPDSRHTAYQAPPGVVMRDGRRESNGGDPQGGLVFSPDSRCCAYVAYFAKTKENCVVCDGKKDQIFKTEKIGTPAWAPDSKSYAYTVSQGNNIGDKWVVFWGHVRLGPYDMIEGIKFNPDSKQVAFRALAKGKWSVMVMDRQGPEFIEIGDIVFSPSGGRMAYRASTKNGWSIFCDSKLGLLCTEVGNPVFSPDGKLMAYRAVKDGESFVVCGDKQSAAYDEVGSIFFSADGKHVAFAAGRKTGKFIVIDGIESPVHERVILPEQPFDEQGDFRYVIIDKDEASLIHVDWPKDRDWEVAFVFDRK